MNDHAPRKAKLYDNPNVQQSPSQGISGVLPGVSMGLGKYEGLCGKAGASINSINCISLSSSAQCCGCVVNGLCAIYDCCMSYLFINLVVYNVMAIHLQIRRDFEKKLQCVR